MIKEAKSTHGFLKPTADHISDSLHAAQDYTGNFDIFRRVLNLAEDGLWNGGPVHDKVKNFKRLELLVAAYQAEVCDGRDGYPLWV